MKRPANRLRGWIAGLYVALSTAAAVVGWIGWCYVHDTSSQSIGGFAFHRLLAYSATVGIALLALALILRVRGARPALLGALTVGIALTASSLADYPAFADNPQDAAPMSPTRDQLLQVLVASTSLALGTLYTAFRPVFRNQQERA